MNDIKNMIHQLGVHLCDWENGLVANTLKTDFNEKYKDFDLITAWECMVDDVNRVQAIIELHDLLVDLNDDELRIIVDKGDGLDD